MAFAAMLMAGLDGIENKMDPGQPLDKDIYDLGPEELAKVPSMPGSLEDALDALERDHAFLLKGDVFTEELLSTYVEYKRTKEVDAVRLRPHPYEFALVLRYLVLKNHQSPCHPDRSAAQRAQWRDLLSDGERCATVAG